MWAMWSHGQTNFVNVIVHDDLGEVRCAQRTPSGAEVSVMEDSRSVSARLGGHAGQLGGGEMPRPKISLGLFAVCSFFPS